LGEWFGIESRLRIGELGRLEVGKLRGIPTMSGGGGWFLRRETRKMTLRDLEMISIALFPKQTSA
jgi:hypothetical protein